MGQTVRPAPGHSGRLANYELLRIVAMLMVVTLHYLSHTGSLLEPGQAAQGRQALGTLIESFCIVAVDVYVLISGYFLSEAGFRVKRALALVGQALFYSLVIPLVLMGTGSAHKEMGLYSLLPYLFPLQAEHYWFATSYLFLYLFTPFLNAAVKHMGKRQMQVGLAGLLFVFCGIKSLVPVYFAADRFGYDFGWFLCVYLTGAYIRKHGLPWLDTARKAWGCYFGCGLFLFLAVAASWLVHEKTGALAYYAAVPFHYNYIVCLAGAVALFAAFGYVRIPAGKRADRICRLSALTFGVYLFHEHLDIRGVWVGWIEEFIGPVAETGLAGFLAHLAVSVTLVYAAGTFADMVRLYIFRYIGRYAAKSRTAKKVKDLDGIF